eukprot:TRINITY_DN4215_c0_g2_i3.p2 TRINITY_DN4215_c0_g2~~TRINITY_DN4215_c0_g2_i3.p2  ORF type:complete len:135 (-),score=44.20 TRINITY_DN4215_c0_g2_i3:443-847(-)
MTASTSCVRVKLKESVELGTLESLCLNGLDKIGDESVARLCAHNTGLRVLELCRCSGLSIALVENIIKSLNYLQVININAIPKIKLESLKECLEEKPWVRVVQFSSKMASEKDNGLRIPLPPKKKTKEGKTKKK